jgi:hypothetical protein
VVLSDDNRIVHGLWIGNRLSAIEMLTLHSFTDKGHIFYLWVYEPIQNQLPENVILKDANEIIPASRIYRRKYNDPQFKIGKDSLGSPFSDLFRYKLLYEFGGWWVDMDVTCLQPLNLDESYFFRAHPLIPLIGNVMKVPAKSELMRLTYEEVNETCNENTLEWLLPNKILNKFVFELELQNYIREDLSAPDWWEKVEKFIHTNKKFPERWLFIHWMNEEWRTREIDKNEIFTKTSIGNLAEKYGLQTCPNLIIERIKRTFRYSFR